MDAGVKKRPTLSGAARSLESEAGGGIWGSVGGAVDHLSYLF